MEPARRAAVFDMDGVLIDNSRFHREAWRRLAREEGFALTDPEFWRQAIGRPVEEAVPRILGRPVPPAEAVRLAQRKTTLYHELADGQASRGPSPPRPLRTAPPGFSKASGSRPCFPCR
jgi:beta-phosphoglucomutase